MFIAFHSHLKLYETQRICQCGACSSANNLTLKIVAHFGNITQSNIKEHVKLFGQDVITVHRLLKNDIPHHEYALFTSSLMSEWQNPAANSWAQNEEGSAQYDVGIINYNYVPLAPLMQSVPEPQVENFSIPGVSLPVFSFEQEVNAPLGFAFEVLSDLPARLHWMQGAKKVEMLNHQLNRVGTKHRCIIDKNSPAMLTTGRTKTDNTITLTETDEKKMMCSVYTLRQEGEALTRIRVDGFIKNDFVFKIVFALLLKKKLSKLFRISLSNFKSYCEELHKT